MVFPLHVAPVTEIEVHSGKGYMSEMVKLRDGTIFLYLRAQRDIERFGMDAIAQYFSFAVKVAEPLLFLSVGKYGVLSYPKSPIGSALSFSRSQRATKNAHRRFQNPLTDALRTEFIFLSLSFLDGTGSRRLLQTTSQRLVSRDSRGRRFDNLFFSNDIRFTAQPDHFVALVFELEKAGCSFVVLGVFRTTGTGNQ